MPPLVPANRMLQRTDAKTGSVQWMCERTGVVSLGALTALQKLEFDLAHHHSMSDDALRQLERLRLTSLSLPGLRLVRVDVCMHDTRQSVSCLDLMQTCTLCKMSSCNSQFRHPGK